jgi:hypothetical protein
MGQIHGAHPAAGEQAVNLLGAYAFSLRTFVPIPSRLVSASCRCEFFRLAGFQQGMNLSDERRIAIATHLNQRRSPIVRYHEGLVERGLDA